MLVASEVIEILIGPVVMISANGLLCLAFYNRLANVMSRCRAINKERVDLETELAELGAEQLELPRRLQWKRHRGSRHMGSQLFRRPLGAQSLRSGSSAGAGPRSSAPPGPGVSPRSRSRRNPAIPARRSIASSRLPLSLAQGAIRGQGVR